MTTYDMFDSSFAKELYSYVVDYKNHLSELKLTRSTIDKHELLLLNFIEYLEGYTAVSGFEAITKAHLNSKFKAYLKPDHADDFSDSFITYSLKEYFSFILKQYGISTATIKITLGIN